MKKRLVCLLAAVVACLCILAFFATCAALFLMDGAPSLPFLDKVVGVEALLTCGSGFLVLGMIAFSLYVSFRRTAHI